MQRGRSCAAVWVEGSCALATPHPPTLTHTHTLAAGCTVSAAHTLTHLSTTQYLVAQCCEALELADARFLPFLRAQGTRGVSGHW